MARKKDSRSRRTDLQKKRKRRNRKTSARLRAFHGQGESLERRELLAGDVAASLDPQSVHSGTLDQSNLDVVASQQASSIPAAPPVVYTALQSELGATTKSLPSNVLSLDVSGIALDLIIRVTKGDGNNNTISVQKMAASGAGEGDTVTYEIENDAGSLANLVAGRQNQKVKIILDGALDRLELTQVDDFQFAIGHYATKASLLTKPTWVQVVQNSKGEIGTLEVGQAGKSSDVELLIGRDIHIDTLKKGSTFSGHLNLHYPDQNSSSRPVKLVDLSLAKPLVRGFGTLQGFNAQSFNSVKTGNGRHELNAGDQSVSMSAGDGDDVLIGGDNTQTLDGEGGKDHLTGGSGDDTLRGGDDVDLLVGGQGKDALVGGSGDDVYQFGESGQTDQNQWGTDTITESAGDNVLDFENIHAQLDVEITGDDISVKSTKQIDGDAANGLSFGSDEDAVVLRLTSADTPTASVSNGVVDSVTVTSLTARMIVGSARNQITVASPTTSEIEAKIDQLASVSALNVNVEHIASELKLDAGALAIAVKRTDGSWTYASPGTKVVLSDLLPTAKQDDSSKSLDDATNAWTLAETTLTLAMGEFQDGETAEFEASRFDVTFFGESMWTGGFTGTQAALETALEHYFVSAKSKIQTAATRAQILRDQGRVDEITEELWLDSIATAIQTTFSLSDNVSAEVLPRGNDRVLSVSIEGHQGDIAIAPTTVSLPATLWTSMPEQSVTGTAHVSRFIAPANDNAQVHYKVTSLTRDWVIDFRGVEAKSTLDLSSITDDLRITFAGPGEVEVQVGTGTSAKTIVAGGIAKLVVGNGDKTFVLTEPGGERQMSVEEASSSTGQSHLAFGRGFAGATIVVNNDPADWTVGGTTYAGNTMEFNNVDFTAPHIGAVDFDSVVAEPGFLGNLQVNGVDVVETGRGDDIVRQTAATPANTTLKTGAGNDQFEGHSLADVVDGGDGNDVLRGNAGDDTLTGGRGDDELSGGIGNDTLAGGRDNDTYVFAPGWGTDSVVEEPGEGKNDVIVLSAITDAMVHVISENNYHAFTGTDHIQSSQNLLTGSVRSGGAIRIKDGSNWVAFDPTNTAHVDDGADRVSVTGEKFQNIEGIKTSDGSNVFYFGNDWGPSSFWATAGSSILPGVSALNRDRTLEIDTTQADALVLDFRQVTDELKFTFEREDDGSLSMTIVKTDGLKIPFLDTEILEDGDVELNKIKFTRVDDRTTIYGGREANTFSLDGDAQFSGTIIGGEGFRDWVGAPDTEGLTTGEKALEWAKFIFEKMETLHTLLGGELPDIFVSNKIDYTDATPFVASGTTAWEVAKSGLKSLFHSVRLREVGGSEIAASVTQEGWHSRDHGTQSLVLAPSIQSFKLVGGGTETSLINRSSADADANVIGTAVAALGFSMATSPGNGTSASPWQLTYTGSSTPEALRVLAYDDLAGDDDHLINEFGSIWSKAAPTPEIQTLSLDDLALATSLTIQIGSQSVTWNKGPSGFDLADFHTANATSSSPILPISNVTQVTGSGSESDPWQFEFDGEKGDLPLMGVTVTGGSSGTAVATAQTIQDGENSLAEIQSYEKPEFTYRLAYGGQQTAAIAADATNQQIADAINSLSSLPSSEAGRVKVTGDGTNVTPYKIAFADPGDRTLVTIEPAWLDHVASSSPAKYQLNLGAATGGTFQLKHGSTTSSNLGYRPTAEDVKTALAAITNVSADKIAVTVLETAGRLTKTAKRFELEIDDSTFTASSLEIVTAALTHTAGTVTEVKAGANYSQATVVPAETVQQVKSNLTSGSFVLRIGNRTSIAIPYQATGASIKSALAAVLGHEKFTVADAVVQNGTRTWTLTFDPELGNVPAIEAIAATGGTQRAHGFATLRNIDSVDYGAGVNYLEGQNIDIGAAAGSFKTLMEDKDFFAFIEQFFGGGLQAGDDTFSVGSNVLTMARDNLVEQASKKAGRDESVLDTLEESYPWANKVLETALGPWFGGTIAPGAHVLAGLTGADTYKFEGIYGAAAVLEHPDIEVAGFAVPEGYDTLDFSGTDYDITVDIYQAALSDIPGIGYVLEAIPGLLGHDNMPLLDVTSNVIIVRDNAISDQLSNFTLGAVDSSEIFGDEAGNVLLALDIENLVLGEGETTIRLHGDASIQGTIATHDDGKLFLDYSDYDEPLDVDGQGGVQWEIIPELELIPEFQIGDLTVEAVKYPGVQIEFGRASGVEGNRLMGLTQLVQVLEDWGVDTTSLTGFRPPRTTPSPVSTASLCPMETPSWMPTTDI